jgi:hypothetical protein
VGQWSGGLQGAAAVQLEDVVSQGDERPLAADLGDAPEQEVEDSARGLDLAEDGFDDGLAPGVYR